MEVKAEFKLSTVAAWKSVNDGEETIGLNSCHLQAVSRAKPELTLS